MGEDLDLPPGYRLLALDAVDSTNAEAMRRARAGEPGGLWVRARAQTAGRGREGRRWESLAGNLHASLLLRLECPLSTALQLSLLAGVAAFDAVADLGGERLAGRLALKWPNDLLLGGAKLGGVLLESMAVGQGGCAVIVGTGLNLAGHPADLPRPGTDLAAHGLAVSPSAALGRLALATARWLEAWSLGGGFQGVKDAWERRAIPLGQPILVRVGRQEIEGRYGGIDAAGALRLLSSGGAERRIAAGDVFMVGS